MGEVTAWWAGPDLDRVWSRVAERLERNGLRAEGRCSVDGLDRGERHSLGGLLGRAVTASRVVIDLAELEERLRSRATVGLVEACEWVLGRRLEDRKERAALEHARRAAPAQAAASWLADRPAQDWPWVDEWLDGLRRDRLLGLDDDPTTLVTTALAVLFARRGSLAASVATPRVDGAGVDEAERRNAEAPRGTLKALSVPTPQPPVARAEVAARLCHDAHALDDDRRLSFVVLRAVALATRLPAPVDARTRRELWATVGVLTDSLSATCLVWGLTLTPPQDREGDTHAPTALPAAPTHLTWWHLTSGVRVGPPVGVHGAGRVLVCENPRVLEAIAQAGPPDVGVVCTSGRPNLPTHEVLAGLAASGTPLLYHGDFDWPGVAMANDAVARYGAQPFRMSCADYDRAAGSLPLKGPVVEPTWDAELGASMRRRGVAVHEEAVLDDLLAGL